FAKRRHRRDFALPGGEKRRVRTGKRIDPNTVSSVKEKNKSVRSAADFQHPRILSNRAHVLEQFANPPRRFDHRRNYFRLSTANPPCLLLLVTKLTFKRAPSPAADADCSVWCFLHCRKTVGDAYY